MLRFLCFGLGVGAGVQAWRNVPAGEVTPETWALVFCLGMWLAFRAGRRGSGGATATATAIASASANAQQAVNVQVVVPSSFAGSSVRVPSSAAPWFLQDGEIRLLEASEIVEQGVLDDQADYSSETLSR